MSAAEHRHRSHDGCVLPGIRAVMPSVHLASITPAFGSPSVRVRGVNLVHEGDHPKEPTARQP
eukprot:1214546-Pleurochrysis_carterae.AAC.1